jgi:hypothetical protein
MSVESVPSRLSLVMHQVPEDVFEPEFVPEAPFVQFEAYADDSRLFGWVRLDADRLTDLLNGHDELQLFHVEIESLVDGRVQTAEEVTVRRDELVAVHASGPRGRQTERRRTRKYAAAVQTRHYLVGGYVHAPAGVDVGRSVAERPPMIPLTDAWIEYWSGGRRKRQWVGTIVVNRELAESWRFVSDEELAFGRLRPSAPTA